METAHSAEQGSGAGPQSVTASPDRTAGQSWMVWLRQRGGENPGPARAGLERGREAHVLGRCMIVLPQNGHPYSFCRRGGQAAFLYGYLLNREDLQKRLELPAAPAPTDAELLLAAYATWGSELARELEGAYAAVVWDETNDTLICIRDPLAARPLFYARCGAGLVVASDLWTLLRHPDVPRRVDRVVVAEHLLWRHPPVEDTFWVGIRRVPAAHQIIARGTDFAVVRYWDPCPSGEPMRWLDRDELAQFPELMHRTVASFMAVGPTAVSLSAGLDSASVAAFAAEAADANGWPRPHALCGYAGHRADLADDERAGQKAMAEALQMPLRFISLAEGLGGQPLLESAMAISPTYPSPVGNMWEHTNIHLVEVARSLGIQVILTGTGGDEWLGVTVHLAADLIRTGDIAGLWHLYRSVVRGYRLPPAGVARNVVWNYGLRVVLRDAAYRYFPRWAARRRQPVALPDWIAPDPELRRRLFERLEARACPSAADPIYVREINGLLQSWIVTWEMEAFYYRTYGRGVTYFHPYWSRPIVEFLLRTPPRILNEGARSRGLIRRMLAERFPQLGFERQKKILHLDFYRRLVEQEWTGVWQRYAPDSALARAGVADLPHLEQAMQGAMGSNLRAGFVAQWLSTEAWLRAHL